MKVLGIYGSPRKGGNSDIILDEVLKGAESTNAETSIIDVMKLKISGCRECNGCLKTGKCVIRDDMDQVYPKLLEADLIVVSSPIFFYSTPAQLKVLIDRAQSMWSKRMLEKKTPDERKTFDGGKGYLLSVGATGGDKLFAAIELTIQYFYDALDMSYEGGLFFSKIEAKGVIRNNPENLKKAFEFGVNIVSGER